MAKLFVYDSYENRMLVYNNLNENDPMPYSYGSTLSVQEFRGSSNARVLWTTTRAMEAWNLTRRRYGAGIPVGYAFKRIWEGGHGTASQHYAGVAFDVGQGTSRAIRQRIHAAATATRAWGYVEPLSMTPTWVHFDRRYGTPACSGTTSGYPTCRRGDKNTYVLILQDALNALGYSTKTLDGAFGQNTYDALRAAQRSFSLTADGVCGCNTWKKLTSAVVGIGRTNMCWCKARRWLPKCSRWCTGLPTCRRSRASPNRMRPRYCLWLSARMKACPAAMIPIPDLPLPT